MSILATRMACLPIALSWNVRQRSKTLSENMTYLEKSKRLLGGTFIVYALLVATNLGEFWPFSIYPMFSQAGRSWVRTIVRDVSDRPVAPQDWTPVNMESLDGLPYALEPVGINQNDVANFVSKSSQWTPQRTEAIRRVYREALRDRTLLVYRAQGTLSDDGSISVAFTPYVLMSPDSTWLHPEVVQ